MGSSIKSILILAVLAIIICNVRAQEDIDSLATTDGLDDYGTGEDFGDYAVKLSKPVSGSEKIQKTPTEVPVKNSCDHALSKEEPKTEQTVIRKAGKKYRVITITLPIETEDRAQFEAVEPSIKPVVEEATTPKPEASIDYVAVDDPAPELEEPEAAVEEPKSEAKAKKGNKKYKRDVGKKIADKKSSKRKSKGQEKRKSKK